MYAWFATTQTVNLGAKLDKMHEFGTEMNDLRPRFGF